MIDPFSRTQFHPELNLETWYPEGIMDAALVEFTVAFIGFEERVLDKPFNRFADFSKLTAIQLEFSELVGIAAKRRADVAGRPPVKTAILATTAAAHWVAAMFATLMEASPVEIRSFRKIEDAAQWLDVPVEALQAEQ